MASGALCADGWIPDAGDVCRGGVNPLGHGLMAAHERGFAHRDLELTCLMLSPEGRVESLDFGPATPRRDQVGDLDLRRPRALTTRVTAAGVPLGTADRASPGRAERTRQDITCRASVCAVGVTPYDLPVGAPRVLMLCCRRL